MDLTFVDENDFQKRGKCFFWSVNSSWEISSTISVHTNDSLADISELNGECIVHMSILRIVCGFFYIPQDYEH